MTVGHPAPPFRWNVGRREQLGRLLAGWGPTVADKYLTELLVCASRVVAFCADGDLHFVGRSPDSIFDLLSGVLAGTSWEGRLRQLPVSLRLAPDMGRRTSARLTLRRYLTALELTPQEINARPRPTVLVDMVDSGGTYGALISTWHDWAEEAGVPWKQVRGKLRLIGITRREKVSPTTWRWHQHASWVHLLGARAIKNVAMPEWVWADLTSRPKASRSFPPHAWTDPTMRLASHEDAQLTGLREAAFYYETGRAASTRERFAAHLANGPGVRAAWLRSLTVEIRAHPGEASGYTHMPDDAAPTIRAQQRREANKRRRPTWRAATPPA